MSIVWDVDAVRSLSELLDSLQSDIFILKSTVVLLALGLLWVTGKIRSSPRSPTEGQK